MGSKKRTELYTREKEELKQIGAMIARGEEKEAIETRWENLVSRLAVSDEPVDINSLIQHVLQESYIETNRDLEFYAEKLKYFNSIKQQIREHLKNLRTTRGMIDDQIESMENDLQTVGDDAELVNIDLQNMLQKTQQTIQMMSNVSKVLHDTAMAVIRKIG
jgi:chromosome segregation ATPase